MLTELVDRARRRYLWNEILAQGAWATSAAMGAVVLLLLAGTQILEWEWLVLLPAATLAAGIWRTMRRLPSRYAIAQLIDARLGLSDTLSTALYFSEPGCPRPASESVRDAQRERAGELSRTVDPRQAIPFTMPRAVYSMAILAVAATSLFALRYGLERRLNLERPLARVIQHALGLEEQQLAALDKKQKDPAQKRADLGRVEGFSLNDANQPGPIPASDAASLQNASAPPSAEQKTSRPGDKNMQGLSLGEDSESGEGEAGEGMETSQGEAGEQGPQGFSPNGQPGQKGSPNENGGSEGNNSSLLAKFRDAMQNLLSRMRQAPAGASGAHQQSAQGQNARQGQKSGTKQGGSQGQQKGTGQESAQGGQDGQDAQMAQNGGGRGKSDGAQNESKQPGSGIGRQDGDKDVKLAEQLKAMGKISEIIGKRSMNISGEVTMEVQSNNQQLATPYSRRSATHGEAAADIGRDEVPMALQSYVQQYFEQVRKQPGK